MAKDLSHIPGTPGCYLMKDWSGKVIYVGKAKNLKKRVSSYFAKTQEGKTALLVSEIDSIDFISTGNEKEALLLENNLIKQHSPKFNIALRDSKRYAYIKFTKSALPSMLTARRITDDATYIGPFSSGIARQEAMRLARRLFGVREVKKETKRELTLKEINRFTSPLFIYKTQEEYQANVRNAILFLSKKTSELIANLESEMKQHSRQQNFEAAKSLRDKLSAIRALSEKQSVELQHKYDKDIIAFVASSKEVLIEVFHLKRGVLAGKDDFRFRKDKFIEDDLPDFLMQYYEDHAIPGEVILERDNEDYDSLSELLSEQAGRKVKIIIPARGENLELLSLVRKNALLHLDRSSEGLIEAQRILRLKTLPKLIECFDVSNTSGKESVGSMVQFLDGQPNKAEYRRFRIRAQEGPNDFAMINEIVFRRYHRQKLEGKPLPDIIIVDGGKGQLKYAKAALAALSLLIPIVGLAKKEETIIFPNGHSQKLDLKNKGSKLIQQVRNEAHRFAVKYHRLLRGKKLFDENL